MQEIHTIYINIDLLIYLSDQDIDKGWSLSPLIVSSAAFPNLFGANLVAFHWLEALIILKRLTKFCPALPSISPDSILASSSSLLSFKLLSSKSMANSFAFW